MPVTLRLPAGPLDVGLASMPLRPLVLHVALDLALRPDADGLARAIASAERSHPVLSCRLAPGLPGDRWVAVPAGDPFRQPPLFREANDVDAATREWISSDWDIRTSPPLRACFLASGAGGRLMVSVRHEAGDGAGALAATRAIVHDLVTPSRPEVLAPSSPPPSARSPWRIIRAIRFSHLPWLCLDMIRQSLLPLRWLGFACPVPIPGRSPLQTGPATWRSVSVDASDRSQFRRRCRDASATVNDGLLSALLVFAASTLPGPGRVACFYTADLRRMLPSTAAPVVANLSSGEVLDLSSREASSLDAALPLVARRTARLKRLQTGLAFFLVNCFWSMVLPHGLVRPVALLFARWAGAILARSLSVTNIGPLDHWFADLGEAVTHAQVIGPALSLSPTPLLTVTSFRDVLTINVNGFEDDAPLLDAVAEGIRAAIG